MKLGELHSVLYARVGRQTRCFPDSWANRPADRQSSHLEGCIIRCPNVISFKGSSCAPVGEIGFQVLSFVTSDRQARDIHDLDNVNSRHCIASNALDSTLRKLAMHWVRPPICRLALPQPLGLWHVLRCWLCLHRWSLFEAQIKTLKHRS